MPRAKPRQKPAPAAPPPEAPLPAELLRAPGAFGQKLRRAATTPWHYWPAPVLAGVLSGLAYALLLRPGTNLAAAEAVRAAGKAEASLPTFLNHVTNAFGSFFLTSLTFLAMWGLGRLGAGTARDAKVAEVYGASFVLLVPLYLLSLLLTLLTPAAAWALDPAATARAGGNLLELQRVALHAAAHTPAALVLVLVSLLGTLGQFALAYPALCQTTGDQGKALRATLLPALPALLIQLASVGAVLLARSG